MNGKVFANSCSGRDGWQLLNAKNRATNPAIIVARFNKLRHNYRGKGADRAKTN
jgi:hypothetical protein